MISHTGNETLSNLGAVRRQESTMADQFNILSQRTDTQIKSSSKLHHSTGLKRSYTESVTAQSRPPSHPVLGQGTGYLLLDLRGKRTAVN